MSERTVYALIGAIACAAVALATWGLAFRTGLGAAADARVLGGLAAYSPTRLGTLALGFSALCNEVPYAALAAVTTAFAFRLRGGWAAVIVAALLVVPNAVTQILKRELAEDRGPVSALTHVDPAAFPSGHATAAASLALAALIIAPAGWRLLVALGGTAFVAGMAGSVVLLGWHFPSDAVGGVAIAGAGGCCAAAALSPRAATAAPRSRWQRATG